MERKRGKLMRVENFDVSCFTMFDSKLQCSVSKQIEDTDAIFVYRYYSFKIATVCIAEIS